VNHSSTSRILQQVLDFLEVDGPVLLGAEERASLVVKTGELLDKARKPGEVLYVGILGGTGVGKSTLINALAQDDISPASERRPLTDKAVVYRHRDTPRGLEEIAGLVREPDAIHDSDSIRDLVLLDLPDFDSAQPENRRTVLGIIPLLDAVVWVVSPEKYADAAFYEFAQQISIDRDNFTFVLNKADELMTDDGLDPHLPLKDVLGDLTFRLRHETGLDQPRIFCISAACEFHRKEAHPVLNNEFRRFRDYLMVRRDAKEIASMKTANLMERTRLLLQDLNQAVQPDDKSRVVANIRRIDNEAEKAHDSAELLLVEQEQKLAAALVPVLMAEDRSISPVKAAMKILGFAKPEGPSAAIVGIEPTFEKIGRTLAKHWAAELNHAKGRIDSEFILSFRETDAGLFGERSERLMQESLSRAFSAFDARVTANRRSIAGAWSVRRRWLQKLALWFPVALLIIRLTGNAATGAFWDHPDIFNGVKLVLSFLTSIFSSDGLTGLIALMIWEIALILYLAAARVRKIERTSRNLARFGINQLNTGLLSTAQMIRSEREDVLLSIEQGLGRLSALTASLEISMPARAMRESTRSEYVS
jgi:GTP-binding protein EngB required for normal cell division